jgi:hypothetical protein
MQGSWSLNYLGFQTFILGEFTIKMDALAGVKNLNLDRDVVLLGVKGVSDPRSLSLALTLIFTVISTREETFNMQNIRNQPTLNVLSDKYDRGNMIFNKNRFNIKTLIS